MIVKKK
jgi:hypothetical protein